MRVIPKYLSLLFLVTWFIFGCGEDPTSPQTGTLKIHLTDAPAAYEAVNVTISEVSAHINEEWVIVSDVDTTINLLDFSNGQTIVIGSADVPVGRYSQIRLKISQAEVIENGQAHSTFVPSGTQTGLKLIAQFDVQAGSTYELILDFDAQRSIVKTGAPNNPKGYILKPTIRVISTPLTGSISGTVSNAGALPVAFALAGSDTVTSSLVDKNTGDFMLAFLPPGDYTVSVRDTLDQNYEMAGVSVEAGADHDLGVIDLQ